MIVDENRLTIFLEISKIKSIMKTLDTISFGKIVQIREKIVRELALGKTFYRFESGDPDFSVAPHVADAMKAALAEGKTHYIQNNGIPQLRKALARKCNIKNQLNVNEDDIFVTNGAMHALFVVFQCILRAGDEVIVPEPLWTEINDNIRLAGGHLIRVPLTEQNHYAYTLEAIKNYITPNTKAIFVNSPHNPTGAIVEEKELRKIAEYAKEQNLYLVSDEAYEDLVFEGTHFSCVSAVPNYEKGVTLFSFSKSHAMTGLRVGYIVTKNKQLHIDIPKLLRCSVNGINSVAQWGALAAIEGPQDYPAYMLQEYQKRRDIFYYNLKNIPGLHVFKPSGAFYIWCTVQQELLEQFHYSSANELSDYLISQGIGNSPGDCFGSICDNALRFSFSGSTQMVQEGSKRIRNLLFKESSRFVVYNHSLESHL